MLALNQEDHHVPGLFFADVRTITYKPTTAHDSHTFQRDFLATTPISHDEGIWGSSKYPSGTPDSLHSLSGLKTSFLSYRRLPVFGFVTNHLFYMGLGSIL